MTHAIRVHAHGGPEVLLYESADLVAVGPGEVRVRHHAIGVNFIDIYFRNGAYKPPSLPFTPGNEGAGEVIAVGSGVEGFSVGDRVAYVGALGAYAQERNISTQDLVRLPDTLSFEMAASLLLKGLTASYLLHRTYPVKSGDTILFHAAAGGVGLLLCQWAKRLGCTVIGTVGSREKEAIARANGCDHVILYREEDFPKRVREITGGALCDVVYDGVGRDTFPGSLDCLKPFGLFASFGSASGPIEGFDLTLLAQKGSLFATRQSLFTYMQKPEIVLEMANGLFEAVTDGTITVDKPESYSLAEAALAHRALESRQTTGSMVLIP